MKKRLSLIAVLLLIAGPAFAQSTATPSQIGYLTTSGCSYGLTVCFMQYGAAIPVTISGGSGDAVFGPTAIGSPASTPPVYIGGSIGGGATSQIVGLNLTSAGNLNVVQSLAASNFNVLATLAGGSTVKTGPYTYTPLGCGQLAAFSTSTLLSSVSGGIPAGATLASLSVETNTVHYRDDATAPTATVGTPLYTGLSAWPYSGTLSAIRFIPVTGSSTVDVCFYQ